MVEVDGKITIDRPPDEVFDFVANEPRYNRQMGLAERITEGPIGVGTSFRAQIMGKARVVPMTIEFTEFDRPPQLAERVDMKMPWISPAGSPSSPPTVERACGGLGIWEPHGVLRFVGPVVASMGRRQEPRIWTRLKQLHERPVR